MSIRSAAKAIIIRDGKVLLNKCSDRHSGEYYSLPGGGQHDYETLHEALSRECLEETGYDIKPVRFAGLCEEICMHESFRQKYPDYAHKMYHIFICEPINDTPVNPTEIDSMQEGSEWIAVADLPSIRILPVSVGQNIMSILDGTADPFLGSEHIEFNHG